MGRIHLSPPDVGDSERDALLRAFDSNWITPLGPEVDAFEAEVCELTGAPAAAALVSGTAALHLALLMAGVGDGDEVWVSTLTFVAPANAVRYVGAGLRFIDSERETWGMDPDLLESELSAAATEGRLPAAVIVVDIYGQCAQLDRISALCERYEVPLIEDAAEAIGATWQGRSAGTWGDYGAFSFNGNKIITTGGGGMLVGRPDEMERARYLASQARKPVLHYEHEEVGYNYRLSNILAALGRAQIQRLPSILDRCAEINAAYHDILGDLEGVEFMPVDDRGTPNHWLTVITLSDEAGATPAQVCEALSLDDIEARPAWKPMHLQRTFAGMPVVGGAVAAELFERGVCVPSGSSMSDGDVERVAGAIRDALVGSNAR